MQALGRAAPPSEVVKRVEGDTAVWSGSSQFAALPAWLNAAADPDQVSRALAQRK